MTHTRKEFLEILKSKYQKLQFPKNNLMQLVNFVLVEIKQIQFQKWFCFQSFPILAVDNNGTTVVIPQLSL